MSLFSQMPVALSSAISIIVMSIYVVFLYRITSKRRDTDKLLWAFAVIALLGAICHLMIFCQVATFTDNKLAEYDNWVIKILFSIQYSLEMFLANTIIYKGEVYEALSGHQLLFHSYLLLYGMAILTSGFTVFHFLSRILYTWMWLRRNKTDAETHIFIGKNKAAKCLADDIAKNNSKAQIIFIDLPNKQDGIQGLSVWDIIARFFKRGKNDDKPNNYIVLDSGAGIGNITKWLKKKETKVYILSNNQAENIEIMEHLWDYMVKESAKLSPNNKAANTTTTTPENLEEPFECTIFCHAKREGLASKYETISDKIKIVDSSFLAVESLKKQDSKPDMLPVNYVDIAQDKGKKLGYVTSQFNCAIVGFGETGREALKFLYEFGAFPNKDNNKASFKCHIFDDNIEMALGGLQTDIKTLKSSVAHYNEFKCHNSCSVNTAEFRKEIGDIINKLNYIVVCLGNDNLNLETALNIAECAVVNGKNLNDKFCIAVRLTNMSKLNESTIAKANEIYDNCIKVFGQTEDIWKLNIITNEELNEDARKFYESYKAYSDVFNKALGYDLDPAWEDREKQIRNGNYKDRCSLQRKRAQDYSNCLHKTTKQILCGDAPLADDIYEKVEAGSHCKGGSSDILEHLAVCEHLRWEASHLIMGYRSTTGATNDIAKLHNCIKPYPALGTSTQHYDWLVVKNSLKSK